MGKWSRSVSLWILSEEGRLDSSLPHLGSRRINLILLSISVGWHLSNSTELLLLRLHKFFWNQALYSWSHLIHSLKFNRWRHFFWNYRNSLHYLLRVTLNPRGFLTNIRKIYWQLWYFRHNELFDNSLNTSHEQFPRNYLHWSWVVLA